MKQIVFILLLLANATYSLGQSEETTWGIGVRFNGPKGITVKKYFDNGSAVELVAGHPSPWRYHKFYHSHYNNSLLLQGYSYAGNDYIFSPWSLQLHYLKHTSIQSLPRLSWYGGGGARVWAASYYDNYYFNDGVSFSYIREKHQDWGIGADLTIGLEYRFKSIPFTLFYDLTSYVEIVKHPMYINVQGSLGIRYQF